MEFPEILINSMGELQEDEFKKFMETLHDDDPEDDEDEEGYIRDDEY